MNTDIQQLSDIIARLDRIEAKLDAALPLTDKARKRKGRGK